VALLIGPHGAGKTTLIYRIQGEAPDHWLLCRVEANPMLHSDPLLHGLARCIAAPFDENDLANDLHSRFGALRLQGRLPVVVVDDADQLPARSLMALLYLHEQSVEGMPPFALILLAEPAIDATLASQQLHAMGTARFQRLELPPLAPEQMGDYLHHFLRMEGIGGGHKLNPERLLAIHQETAGWPGKVNDLVLRARREEGRSRGFLTWRLRRRLSTIIAVTTLGLVLFALAGILLQTLSNRSVQDRGGRALNAPTASMDAIERHWVVQPLPLPGLTPPLSDAPSAPAPPVVAPLPPPNPLPSAAVPIVALPIERPEPSTVSPFSVRIQEVRSGATGAAPITGAPPSQIVASAARAVETAPVVLESGDVPSPRPTDSPAVADTAPPEHGLKKNAWLLQQSPEAYSLQLAAVGDEAAIQRYITRHGISSQAFYVESRRKGHAWFSLLYGIYPGRAAANAALRRLPPVLRQAGAWPRPLGVVQAELRGGPR